MPHWGNEEKIPWDQQKFAGSGIKILITFRISDQTFRPGSHMSPDKFSTLIRKSKNLSHGRITCGICHLKINITRVDFFVKWSLPSVSPGLVKIPIFGSFILINKTFYFHLAFIHRSISAKRVVKFPRNFVPNYSRIFAFKTVKPLGPQPNKDLLLSMGPFVICFWLSFLPVVFFHRAGT